MVNLKDRLETATDVLGEVRRREEHERDRDGGQKRQLHALGEEQVHEHREEEEHRDERYTAEGFDVDRCEETEDRQTRGASQCEQHTEREAEQQGEDRDIDRHHEAAGEVFGGDFDR